MQAQGPAAFTQHSFPMCILTCNQLSYIMGTRLPNDGGISLRGG